MEPAQLGRGFLRRGPPPVRHKEAGGRRRAWGLRGRSSLILRVGGLGVGDVNGLFPAWAMVYNLEGVGDSYHGKGPGPFGGKFAMPLRWRCGNPDKVIGLVTRGPLGGLRMSEMVT